MNKIIALSGMPGAGKTEASWMLENMGFARLRFGDVTEEIIRRRGLIRNEENEKSIREEVRAEHGMAAYAILNLGKIDRLLLERHVAIDGVYSYEEMEALKEKYEKQILFVAIKASTEIRHARLGGREDRPLNPEECINRDLMQEKNLNIKKTIEACEFKIVNEGTLDELKDKIDSLVQDHVF